MAIDDPIAQNIIGVQQLVGSKLNKTSGGVTGKSEGTTGEEQDEFSLDMSDDQLLELSKKWTNNYSGYEAKIKLRQEANKTWYLGKQKESGSIATTEGRPITTNLLFEAEETFLPAALSKNPEPVVWSDDTSEGEQISTVIKTMLQYHADVLALRRKLTLMTRHWSIYFLGIMKHNWDDKIKEIISEVRNPQNFIFDPHGYIDCYGDYVGPLGERIETTASDLTKQFPEHKDYIIVQVDGKMGTKVTYTEWWTDEYMFCTYKEKVLYKGMNPHYNQSQMVVNPLSGLPETQPAHNHFARPKKPYTFLSVFSLGDQPHDITSLIEQNIPNQHRILRRTEQIDYNLSRQNNSTLFSEGNFNQETAKQASTAMAKGHPVLIPRGADTSKAVIKIPMEGVPPAFFNELESSKNDLRSIFGTAGITATDTNKDETARGMILKTQYDNTRIGGGIGDALEQVADNIFNWWTQLYFVYYDEPHIASLIGQMKSVQYVQLLNADITRKIVVSVSPDSMKPKDEVTEMNQATSLYQMGVLDPKTLLTRLNFPDAQNTAEQVVLWLMDKAAYIQLNFPQLAQQLQAMQQMTQAPMGAPINGGGAPPSGRIGGGQTPAQSPPTEAESAPSASLSQVPLPK